MSRLVCEHLVDIDMECAECKLAWLTAGRLEKSADIARLRAALDLIAESYAEPETDYSRGIKQIACAALKEET